SAGALAAELGGDVRTGSPVRHTDATIPLAAAGAPSTADTAALRPTRADGRARRSSSRRLWPLLALAAVALVAALALALASGGDDAATTDPPRERPARIEPVPDADDPAEQAENLADWIREHSRSD
ncbi:MAG: hypothetical protein KY396_00225, partial [Actinobacteria bacterium]|nr:hypothetical protein [Actinomycetota bacterium]